MLRYLIRRTLLSIPTLIVISMVIFGLSKCAPRDPELELGDDAAFGTLRQQDEAIYKRAERLGFNKPLFYFTLTTAAFPDTLYRIFPWTRREQLAKLCAQTGNWQAVNRYVAALREAAAFTDALPDTLPAAGTFRVAFSELLNGDHADDLEEAFAGVQEAGANLPAGFRAEELLDTLQRCVLDLKSNTQPDKMYIPAFYWHGTDNQYHRWLAGFVQGDLGMSRYAQPVWDSLKFSLLSTLVINGLALLLAYLFAVPLGVAMSRRRNLTFDRSARWVLLFLFAMPVFWLGSLLLLFLATPDFGLYVIKGIHLESYQGSGKTYWEWCFSNFDKFILPILTLTLHALAILALQMRGGILDTIGLDFIRTARAKGVGEDTIYWRHAFRNALFPIITVFTSLFPAIFTGSLVVEYLFQFPGLGMKTQEAFIGGDYPVLFCILMLAATLTVVGNLIADLLYAWADPRVRFARQ
ncbi:MAG: hypothetical protein EPGJADBJ_01345 [Saprospiraceae bacterium]|nr:hypothetical protein [Saprospiraceae bacterium]